jgi:hypothetical protein
MSKCCKSVESRQSVISVSRVFSSSGTIIQDVETVEKISLPNMEGVPTATVSADRAVTKNLGNYNSLKIGCFVSVPCYLDPQEMENAMKFCAATAEARMEKDCESFYKFLSEKYPQIFASVK